MSHLDCAWEGSERERSSQVEGNKPRTASQVAATIMGHLDGGGPERLYGIEENPSSQALDDEAQAG